MASSISICQGPRQAAHLDLFIELNGIRGCNNAANSICEALVHGDATVRVIHAPAGIDPVDAGAGKTSLIVTGDGGGGGRGLHSFTLELNLSNSRTHSCVTLGYTVDRGAQLERKCERV